MSINGIEDQKRPTAVNQETKEKVWVWVLILLFWLFGIMLTSGTLIMKNAGGLIVNWLIILTLSIILTTQGFKIHKKTGWNNLPVIIRLLLSASSIIFLVFATVFIIRYQSNCFKLLNPKTSLCNCQFRNMDLTNRDLNGSDFTNAVFYKTNLKGADLENANLTNANLAESNLTNTKLTGVIMKGTNLQGTIGINDEILCSAFKIPEILLSAYLTSRKICIESNESIGNSLKNVCFNNGGKAAKEYKQDSSFHPIILYELNDSSYTYKNKLPENFLPMAVRFCELVCITEEKKEIIQTCSYTPTGTMTRYQYQMNVIIKSAKTAELISQKTFYGQEPSDCPETITSSGTKVGSRVKFKDVAAWLQIFVNPPRINDKLSVELQ